MFRRRLVNRLAEFRARVSVPRLRAAIKPLAQLRIRRRSPATEAMLVDEQETLFVTDTPTDLSVSDAFGHKAYAEAIAGILAEARAPFTLGLFGDWGFGKTSVIDEVGRRMVSRGDCAFASFDVWRYQGDALRRQFLRDIAQQLHERGFLRRRYKPAKALRDLEVDVTASEQQFRVSWRGTIIAVMQGAIIGLVVWLFLHSRYPEDILGSTPAKGSPTDIAALVIAGVGAFVAWLGQIIRVDQRVLSLRRIEEPERFLEKFRGLLSAVDRPRLVIAIDNLDRCSPDLVDELLATIKTYLEPEVARPKDATPTVVFMIAADDEAIRRHMIARELSIRSQASEAPTSTESSSEGSTTSERDTMSAELRRRTEAEHYVDEYLRKFFTATIRLKAILDEELRVYVNAQLAGFIKAHAPAKGPETAHDDGEDFEARLVSMVASALRKNPRRVKQFVNSMETKLRVIQARESGDEPQIAPPISGDVLGIAKVTIIEEEWRSRYLQLERDWRQLRTWHGLLGTIDFGDDEFEAFLRTTRDIEPRDLPAILNLKQTERERELPEFNRFREAVTLGDLGTAGRIVAAAPDEVQPSFASELLGMLESEAQAGRVAEALNVLEAGLAQPTLAPDRETQSKMLAYALAHAGLASRLSNLDPNHVLELRSELSEEEQMRLTGAYIDITGIAGIAPNRARATAEQLARIFDELPGDQQARLRSQIATEPFATSHPDVYLPLVDASPELLYDGPVEAIYQRWVGANMPLDSPDLDIAIIGFGVNRAANRIPEFLNNLGMLVQQNVNEKPALVPVFKTVSRALCRLSTVDGSALGTLVSNIQAAYSTWSPTQDVEVLQPLFESLNDVCRFPEAQQQEEPLRQLANGYATEHPQLVADEARRDTPRAPLRDLLLAALPPVISPSYGEDKMEAAATAVIHIDPETGGERLFSQLSALINQDQLAGLPHVVELFRSQLGTRLRELVATLLDRTRVLSGQARTPNLQALTQLAPLLEPDERIGVRDILHSMLTSGEAADVQVGVAFVGGPEASTWEKEVQAARSQAAASLAVAGYNPIHIPVLSIIAGHWQDVQEAARGSLIGAAADWIHGNPSAATAILDAFAPFIGTPTERRALLRAAFDIEPQLSPEERARLILGAWHLRGPDGRVAAAKLVSRRISTLRTSEEPADQQTWAALEPLLRDAGYEAG